MRPYSGHSVLRLLARFHLAAVVGVLTLVLMVTSPDAIPEYDSGTFGLGLFLILTVLTLPFSAVVGLTTGVLSGPVQLAVSWTVGLGVYATVDYLIWRSYGRY